MLLDISNLNENDKALFNDYLKIIFRITILSLEMTYLFLISGEIL